MSKYFLLKLDECGHEQVAFEFLLDPHEFYCEDCNQVRRIKAMGIGKC